MIIKKETFKELKSMFRNTDYMFVIQLTDCFVDLKKEDMILCETCKTVRLTHPADI